MKLQNPLLSLGTDAQSGKPYHLCSSKVKRFRVVASGREEEDSSHAFLLLLLLQSLLSLAIIVLLVLSMSSERFMFKLMVDRMESYRCVKVLSRLKEEEAR